MTESTRYKPGQYYRICDRTGFKVRSTKTKKEWNGYIVRSKSWEPRHPQDLVRGVADEQFVPEARPRPHTVYVKIPVVLTESPDGSYSVPLKDSNGRMIYRGPGLVDDEVPVVTKDSYPNSW